VAEVHKASESAAYSLEEILVWSRLVFANLLLANLLHPGVQVGTTRYKLTLGARSDNMCYLTRLVGATNPHIQNGGSWVRITPSMHLKHHSLCS